VVTLSPELVATLAGWEAAWNESTWGRIQTGRQAVIDEIAKGIEQYTEPSHLRIALAIESDGPASQRHFLFNGGRWYRGTTDRGSPYLRFGKRSSPSKPYHTWAAQNFFAITRDDDRLARPEGIRVEIMDIEVGQPEPRDEVLDYVPFMHFRPEDARLLMAEGKTWGMLDIKLWKQ
jgi:hypothetical protein